MAPEKRQRPENEKLERSDNETDAEGAVPFDIYKPLEANYYEDASSSDSDVGPELPSVGPVRKKRRILPHESLYIAALPKASRYSRSLMHKDQLFSTTFTPQTDFLVTASVDGQVSFWKKGGTAEHVEFVKEFRAHTSEITGTSASWDGRSFASCGKDGSVKVWDVETFDLVSIIDDPFSKKGQSGEYEKKPSCICWVHRKGKGVPLLAIGNNTDGEIAVWDGRGDANAPLFVIKNVHRKPVTCMAYNTAYDCVVSADEGGMVEYWAPTEAADKPQNLFQTKSETNLFDFKKSKSAPCSITISPTEKQFATYSFPDRKIRVFDFASGRLYRTYDESVSTIQEMQQAGTAIAKLDDVEFGRRLATEQQLNEASVQKRIKVIFDETGHFILYGSLHGTKVINTLTNRVAKLYGQEESFRALNLTLYQGRPDRKHVVTVEMAASENPLLREAESRDAMLVATGFGKIRFYMFTNETEVSRQSRDIQNEKPRNLVINRSKAEDKQAATASGAILHTTYGDIHIRLFPEKAPKTIENFVTHAKNNYYNNIIFHRVIPNFMIQTGDPLGDGTGGESIWGKEFEDEFSSLKHDKPYTVSMANAGPNTNASQFFITTRETTWLDGKHTIFGRVLQGMDVVHRIEKVKTYKEKPEEDIKIVNISLR